MKVIELTKGMVAIVDDEWFDELAQYRWRVSLNGYAMRGKAVNGRCKTIWMHRVVMGDPVGFLIDHRNGNKLDNRIENLRPATKSENGMNCKNRKNNTTGFKGVTFFKKSKCFQAFITVDRKQKYLGSFPTAKEAHVAYCAAATELHGAFARFN